MIYETSLSFTIHNRILIRRSLDSHSPKIITAIKKMSTKNTDTIKASRLKKYMYI